MESFKEKVKKTTNKDFKTDTDWWNFSKRLTQEPEYQNYIKGWVGKKAGQLRLLAIQSLAKKFNTTQNVIAIAFNRYMYGGKNDINK